MAPTAHAEHTLKRPASSILREVVETLLLALFMFWLVNSVTGRYRVDGSSMFPTLHDGNYLIVNKLAYFVEEPQRGDVIVLDFHLADDKEYIKRIVGVPGDRIDVSGSTVRVNGVALDEPYVNGTAAYQQASWIVPAGHYFVMGDNRNNSRDSRALSFLPGEDIVGKAWVIYWNFEDWGLVPHFEHHIS